MTIKFHDLIDWTFRQMTPLSMTVYDDLVYIYIHDIV